MKKCSKCGKVKSVDDFCIRRASKDGRSSYCKKCNSENCKKHMRTLKGKAIQIHAAQKTISKKRNHQPPKYSRDEFVAWMLSNEDYLRIHEYWVESGYKKDLAPSCDRLDDYYGYSFSNIRVVTWRENNRKSHLDMKNGINNKQNKAVVKMDLNGVVLEEYHSIRHAARETNVDRTGIWLACNGRITKSGGFYWRYK